jgi:uncharacterized cupin superfamily protein
LVVEFSNTAMEHVSIDEIEPSAFGRDIDRRGLSEPLGTSDLAINYYQLEPGEPLSAGVHTHMDQEEVFVVVDGEATFKTPDGEIVVEEDEAVRFAPGDFQSGHNSGDEELEVLALGAPRDTEDVRVPEECRECGNDNMRAVPGDDGFDLVCPECGAGTGPEPQDDDMGDVGP